MEQYPYFRESLLVDMIHHHYFIVIRWGRPAWAAKEWTRSLRICQCFFELNSHWITNYAPSHNKCVLRPIVDFLGQEIPTSSLNEMKMLLCRCAYASHYFSTVVWNLFIGFLFCLFWILWWRIKIFFIAIHIVETSFFSISLWHCVTEYHQKRK